MISYTRLKKQLLEDKKIKQLYNELEPEMALVKLIIKKRLANGLTQKQLAAKIGIKQPLISRLERGLCNPSIKFLRKIATALGAKLSIKIL